MTTSSQRSQVVRTRHSGPPPIHVELRQTPGEPIGEFRIVREVNIPSRIGSHTIIPGTQIAIQTHSIEVYPYSWDTRIRFILRGWNIEGSVPIEKMELLKIYKYEEGWTFLISSDYITWGTGERSYILVRMHDDSRDDIGGPVDPGYYRAYNNRDYLLDLSNPNDPRITRFLNAIRRDYFHDIYEGSSDLIADGRRYYVTSIELFAKRMRGKKLLGSFNPDTNQAGRLELVSEPISMSDEEWYIIEIRSTPSHSVHNTTVFSHFIRNVNEIDYTTIGPIAPDKFVHIDVDYMRALIRFNHRVLTRSGAFKDLNQGAYLDFRPDDRRHQALFYINEPDEVTRRVYPGFHEEVPADPVELESLPSSTGSKIQPERHIDVSQLEKGSSDIGKHEELLLLRNELEDTLIEYGGVIMGSAVAFMINPELGVPGDVDIWIKESIHDRNNYSNRAPIIIGEFERLGWKSRLNFRGTRHNQRMSPDIVKVYSLSHERWSYSLQVIECAIDFIHMAKQFDLTAAMGIWNPSVHSQDKEYRGRREGMEGRGSGGTKIIGYRNTRREVMDDIRSGRAVFCERKWDIMLYQGKLGEPQRVVLTKRAQDRLIKYTKKGFNIIASDQSIFTTEQLREQIGERLRETESFPRSEQPGFYFCNTDDDTYVPFLKELQRVTYFDLNGDIETQIHATGFSMNLFNAIYAHGHLLGIHVFRPDNRIEIIDTFKGREAPLLNDYEE